MRGRGAATSLRLKTLEKQALKWTSVSGCAVHPRSGRENVAETCAPSPDTNLLLIRGFEKGLAGGGWRSGVPKIQQKCPPELSPPTS